MARKSQRRKNQNLLHVPLNSVSQKAIAHNMATDATSLNKVVSKTIPALNEKGKFQYIKSDLKWSLGIAAGIFALMIILYFLL